MNRVWFKLEHHRYDLIVTSSRHSSSGPGSDYDAKSNYWPRLFPTNTTATSSATFPERRRTNSTSCSAAAPMALARTRRAFTSPDAYLNRPSLARRLHHRTQAPGPRHLEFIADGRHESIGDSHFGRDCALSWRSRASSESSKPRTGELLVKGRKATASVKLGNAMRIGSSEKGRMGRTPDQGTSPGPRQAQFRESATNESATTRKMRRASK